MTTINTLVDRIGMSVRVDLNIEVNVVGWDITQSLEQHSYKPSSLRVKSDRCWCNVNLAWRLYATRPFRLALHTRCTDLHQLTERRVHGYDVHALECDTPALMRLVLDSELRLFLVWDIFWGLIVSFICDATSILLFSSFCVYQWE